MLSSVSVVGTAAAAAVERGLGVELGLAEIMEVVSSWEVVAEA